MNPSIVIAFDPSNKGFAYGVVQDVGRHWRRLDSGGFQGKRSEAQQVIRTLHETFAPDIWAVEDIAGFVSSARMSRQRRADGLNLQDLVDTAQWSGFITAFSPKPDGVVFLPANNAGKRASWRQSLTGNARAGDPDVARALDYHLEGGLPVKAQLGGGRVAYAINEHQRDALGLAVAVGNLLRVPAGVPPLRASQIGTK